ncbi:protein DEFECTIVE IN MERISTEM SILENCING 3 isoform X2 [Malania oleifera]|nr:protein DEFECTIVE IN MERISTEM SILENCING 3 isoform X2 [Malania oleifera]XP_057951577.1 protein DEFECTIVE IN MERISTEM SILENCING 3 isoform X2 [Malania oleifera]
MALSVQDPSTLKHVDQSDTYMIPKEEMQNGALPKAESIVCASKKLQDDLQMLGHRIKQHEENLKFLKNQKHSLEDSILDMQVVLGKYHSSSVPMTENRDISHCQSEEETTEQILRHEKSAAGLLCQLKTRHSTQASHLPLTKDILGIVATLGKVEDDNLSRLFSEYLGVQTMLAVVCRTSEGMKALETYDKDGFINKSSGLHGLGASIGKLLDGRFLVICLENLREYAGEFVADDPQRRLDLLKPRLPNGECPQGFLGFAVNMINVDAAHLFYLTANGCGLRETLFYSLFSRLQVYRTRADMLHALPCISDGALSLDGGMIRAAGIFSLGNREDVDVRFAVGSIIPNLPMNYFETENQVKMVKWKKEKMIEDIKREQSLLDHAKFNFEIKKQEFVKFLAESSSYMTQIQAGRDRMTPR